MTLKELFAVTVLAVLLNVVSFSLATSVYVDDSAVGSNNGSSWPNAYNYLYDAMAVAMPGDTIFVAEGTYLPDTSGLTDSREAAFALINGVTLVGGYAGFGAADPDDRNVELYETVLSGDLMGDDTQAPDDSAPSDNCYHVFYHPSGLNLDTTAILNGFTISGGNANAEEDHGDGGGMFNQGSSPTVTNCIFTGNGANEGGGMFNRSSNPTVTHCTFSYNWAAVGGGMCNSNSSPTLINCTFTGNSAGSSGGGVYNCYSSCPTITNCIFRGNIAIQSGNEIFNLGSEDIPLISMTEETGSTAGDFFISANTGQIHGSKWNDLDEDGIWDAGEPGLANWKIYQDENINGQWDTGEQFELTDSSGNYSFTNLPAGQYVIAEVLQQGWTQTYPDLDESVLQEKTGFLTSQITTSGSKAPIYILGEIVQPKSGQITPSTAQSGPLINMDIFRSDPRFLGIDGAGCATVILDTGIDLDHPYFGPDNDSDGIDDRIVFQYDFADDDNDASDRHGHGSNVSSIVASQNTTNTGMAPGVDIIHLKVFRDSGTGTFGILEKALQWVANNATAYNIYSINMSLSDNGNYNTAMSLYGIEDELAALEAKGVIVVSASGNSFFAYGSQQGIGYPSADSSSLSIGAVYDQNIGAIGYTSGAIAFSTGPDRITPFSQRHATLTTVFAPGAEITGANYNGGTVTIHGTSQSSPHIAGIAVLAQQVAENKLGRQLTIAEFADILGSTGVTINDGDDEDDNVTNTNLNFKRVDMLALAEAILAMGSVGTHTVILGEGQIATNINFGNVPDDPGPTTGPFAAYSMNEGSGSTVSDSSNNGNNGVNYGASWSASGKFGGSLNFNPQDYVDLNNLDIPGSALTIMMWFKADDFGIYDARLISKSNGTSDQSHYWMLSTISGPKLRFRLKTSSGGTTTLVANSGTLSTGVWTHAAVVYDGSNMIIYKDGIEVGRTAKTGSLSTNNSTPSWIGNNPTGNKGFDGMIDEVKIFNTALSFSQIQAEMNTPIDPLPPDSESPTVPTNLTATAISQSRIDVTWSASSDNMSVAGYKVYRNGTEIATTASPGYSDSVLSCGTTYSYRVSAFDATGNESGLTASVSETTLSCGGPTEFFAAYSMNEGSGSTVGDSSNNGNDGTNYGAGWSTSGKFGGSLDFNPQDYVDLDNLDIPGSALTIMLWFKADDFDISDARLISKSNGTATQSHYWMLSTISGPKLRFRLKTSSGGTTTLVANSGTLSTGVWTHAAVVYDGNNMIIYKDGIEVGRTAKTGSLSTNNSTPSWIGNNPTANKGFDGLVDEVKIFNKALSVSDIQTEMNTPIDTLPPLPPDDEPPTVPTNLAATAISQSRIDLTWSASSDNVAVAGYKVYRNGTEIATTTSPGYSDSVLSCGTTYSYTVSAYDAAGNDSGPSSPVSETTLSCGGPNDYFAAYSMNEGSGSTVGDSSDNGYDGTNNGASWSTAGKFAGSLDFNPQDRVELGNLDIPGNALTIMMWFKADDFGIYDARLISKSNGTSDQSHFWMLSTISGPKLRFRLKTSSGGTTTLIANSGTLSTDVWTHAAVVYNSSNMIIYKDGVEVGRTAKTGSLSTNSSIPAWIGNNPTGNKGFDGLIDEVKIFDKALTQAEIQTEMNQAIQANF
jgi:chitodextrinase